MAETSTQQIVVEFVPDTSKVESASTKLTEQEQKALDDGNKSLAKRAELAKDNLTQLAQQVKTVKSINDAFDKQLATAKTVGDQIVVLGQAFEAAFQTGGAEGAEAVYTELGKTLRGTGVTVDEFIAKLKEADPTTRVVAEDTTALRTQLSALTKQMQDAVLAGNDNTEAYRSLQTQAINLQAAIKKVSDDTKLSNDVQQQAVEKTLSLSQQLAQLKTSMQESVAAGTDNTEGYKQMQTEAINLQAAIQKANNDIKLTSEVEQQATEKTVTLSQQLQRLKNDLGAAALAGNENTDEFKAMQEQAAKLQRAINLTNKEVQDSSKGVKAIKGVGDAVTLMAAGFGIAEGAAAIFGAESEEVTKSLVKISAAMTVINGLQEVATALKAKDNVLTKALIVTQDAFTAAIFGSAASLTAFQVALVQTGIGVIIVALGYAIAKLIEYISTLHDATAAQEEFNKVTNNFKSILQERNDAVKHATDLEIESAKQRGASAADEVAIRKKAQDKITQNTQVYVKSLQILNDRLKDDSDELYKGYNGNDKKRQADIKANLALIKDAQKQQASATNEGQLMDARYQTAIVEQHKQAAKDQEKAAKDLATKNKEIRDADAQAAINIINRTQAYIVEQNKKAAQDQTKTYAERSNALKQANEAEITAIKAQHDFEVAQAVENGKDTAEQLLNINDKYQTDLNKAKDEFTAQQKALDTQRTKDLTNAQNLATQNAIVAHLAIVQKGGETENKLQIDLIREQEKAQIADITATVQNTELREAKIKQIQLTANAAVLANTKEFHQKRMQQENEYTKALHDYAIAQIEASVVGTDSDSQKRFEASQKEREIYLKETNDQLAQLDKDYRDGDIIDEQTYQTKRLALMTRATNQAVDIAQAEADRKKKINDAYRDAAIEIAQSISDAIFDIAKQQQAAQLEAKLADLDTAKQKELDNANLTEQEKENINARYDAKEKALQKQAADREKQQAIAQAIINAALAVTKALTSLPFPLNLIAAATTAALAAVQVAKIKSTPTGYAMGTNKATKGVHEVGENGKELIEFYGGEKVHTAAQTRTITDRIAMLEMNTRTPDAIPVEYVTHANYRQDGAMIDTAKLAGAIADEVSKISRPEVHTNIDRGGFDQYMQQGNSKYRYLNKRYKIR